MKEIYSKIWNLARPFYEKGRPMDIEHINWMMGDAHIISEKENIDDTYLLPLVVLHDVGYVGIAAGNPFNLDLRKAHMRAGAEIARDILNKVNYQSDKIDKISYYVSVHDNWAFGDDKIYKDDIILGTFNDLDYMWMSTREGFSALMKILNNNPEKMIEYLATNEKNSRRPFSTKTARSLYEKYLGDRHKEYNLE